LNAFGFAVEHLDFGFQAGVQKRAARLVAHANQEGAVEGFVGRLDEPAHRLP